MHKTITAATICLLSVVAFLSRGSALAQTTINVPRDQPTVQAGINAASDGDTVLVAPGKYVENIDFLGKAITVTSSGGAVNTILDGGATGPVVTFQTSESRASVLSEFTIQNGGGYGVNTTAVGVAGVVVSNSSPAILNNTITQNQCWDIEVLYGAPLIQGNTISSTQSPSAGCGGGSGAGIYVGGNLNGDTSSHDGNAAVIRDNTIENVTVPASLDVSAGSTNLGESNGGGAIAVFAGSPLIKNNILRNNAAPGGNGGAINIAGGFGTTIAQNLIYGNSAGCGGGAISFSDVFTGSGTYLLIANNTIVDNTGGTASLYASCGDVSQIYSVNFGLSSPNVIVVNNIVSSTTSAAPAVGCSDTLAAPNEDLQSIFDHNLLYNAGGSFFGPTCADVSAKYGNLAAAPQFVNAAAGDYHLAPASPGIDEGNNSALGNIFNLSGSTLSTDLDGNSRIQGATATGYPVIDMGAYEHAGEADSTPTTVVLTSSIYTGSPGDPMLLTGAFASALGVPTGDATFFLDGQSLGVSTIESNGIATLNTVLPAAGVHSIYLAYAGQGSFTPARSVILIVLSTGTPAGNTYSTTLQLGSPINPQAYGADVTLVVTASSADPNPAFVPSPVTLTFDGAVLATLNLNQAGRADFTTNTLPVGNDLITATYAGDATHQAATASFKELVTGIETNLTLSCSPLTILIGQTASLIAQVTADTGTGAPTGSVVFLGDGKTLGEVELANGYADLTYLGQSAGFHLLSARYDAAGPYYGTGALCSVGEPPDGITVVGLPSTSVLTVDPLTAPFLTTTNMTASVSATNQPGLGTPTGTVTFSNGAVTLGTVNLVAGIAKYSTIALPAGTNAITCTYSGDTNYAASGCNTVTVNRSVAQSTLTITSSANPALALTQVTFTVALTATGEQAPMNPVVLFSISGKTFPLTLSPQGTAGYVTSTLIPGVYPLSASFAGDANLLGASASLTETVVDDLSATGLSVAPNPGYVGQPVTLTAMVTAQNALVPAGATVTFYDGSTVLGTGALDPSRTATFATSAFSVGTHSLTATYPGASDFIGSTSPTVSETILASSFTITLSPSTVTVSADQTAAVAIELSSMGGFAGPLTLSYGTLPENASASILPSVVALSAGGTGSATLTLDTATPGTVAATLPRRTPRPAGYTAALAAMLVVFLSGRRRSMTRSRVRSRRLFLWLAFTAALLQTVTGCGNKFYTLPGVAPGTYQIQVTAMDVNENKQTATLTLIVPSP